MIKFKYLITFILVILMVFSCGSKGEKNQIGYKPLVKKHVKSKKNYEVSVTKTVKRPYVYDIFRSTDPFQPYISTKKTKVVTGPIVNPLQKYELSSLSLKGIVWGISSPTALIEAPDGKGYNVKVGTPIGKNGGKVLSILTDKVIVLEKFVDFKGEIKTRKVELDLPTKE